MRSVTGRSAITEHSSVTATLGKCKHLLSLVGASASLTRQAVLPAVPSRKEAFPTEKHENRRTGASPRLTAPKGLADFRFAVCRRRMTVTEHLTFLTVSALLTGSAFFSHKKPTADAIGIRSPGRTRTYNNPVNSRVLCH